MKIAEAAIMETGEDFTISVAVVEVVDVNILKDVWLEECPCRPDFISSFDLIIPVHSVFSVNRDAWRRFIPYLIFY